MSSSVLVVVGLRLGLVLKLVDLLTLESYNQVEIMPSHDLRAQSNRIYNDTCRLRKSESSFHKDAARLWNLAPMNIRNALSLEVAKKAIDKYCKSLPI